MGVEQFVRRLLPDGGSDKRFALFLGAGCSVSSGIPAAGPLVKGRWLPRLRDLEAPTHTDTDAWAVANIQGFDPKNPAASYGALIDRLFVTPEDRQREIESLCDGRSPSFGYAVLAQLVAMPNGHFNVVLTTNFDDMVADALYLYTEARPLVIHHEALAAYIRPTRTRPLVVKLHGDHRLSPRNTLLETEDLEQEIRRHTALVLHDRGLIFIGYGGADHGILKLLNGLPDEALPYGAYWVHPEPPSSSIREWLAKRGGVWVRSGWFDEVMLLTRNAFDLPHPDEGRFTRIFAEYQKKWQELSAAIDANPATAGSAALKAAVTQVEASFPDYWKAIAEALRLERTAPDEAHEVYRHGIEQFPRAAPLLGNYALFLKNVRKDFDTAEAMYKRAIEAEPKHAHVLGNFAVFLDDFRKDFDAAEAMYKRAIEADPKHANNLGNYGVFLSGIRKDFDAAEAIYKRAIEADPKHANNLGNYGFFLSGIRKDFDAAEGMYKRAIEADPNVAANIVSNYANFLKNVRRDFDAAEGMYKRAIEADPNVAATLGNYALFLDDVRKDFDAAEAMYKRAIEADPKRANNLGNYGVFLSGIRKDFDAAEAMYKRAIEADPKHVNTLGNYGVFLSGIRKDFDAAETMYKRAIEADPKHVNTLESYATFLKDVRKDFDAAEAMYKRAIEADPKVAATLGNYALFLDSVRKDYGAAEAMFRRAIDTDPKAANIVGNYANFLKNVRRDFDAADGMYKRAIEADPGNSNILGNYAGSLLADGKRKEGLAFLDRALQTLSPPGATVIAVECWFYMYAHGAIERRAPALATLRQLLKQDVRSPGWDLSANVKRAVQDGHPEGSWLAKLAAVVNGDSEPSLLDPWPAWKAAITPPSTS